MHSLHVVDNNGNHFACKQLIFPLKLRSNDTQIWNVILILRNIFCANLYKNRNIGKQTTRNTICHGEKEVVVSTHNCLVKKQSSHTPLAFPIIYCSLKLFIDFLLDCIVHVCLQVYRNVVNYNNNWGIEHSQSLKIDQWRHYVYL